MTIRHHTRRHLIAAGGALAAVPLVAALPAVAASETPIARLYARAGQIERALVAVGGDAMGEVGGLPGWMRTSGDINRLGHQRYETLVAILKTAPRSRADLAIVANVARDRDMAQGPALWATAQVARATEELARAA